MIYMRKWAPSCKTDCTRRPLFLSGQTVSAKLFAALQAQSPLAASFAPSASSALVARPKPRQLAHAIENRAQIWPHTVSRVAALLPAANQRQQIELGATCAPLQWRKCTNTYPSPFIGPFFSKRPTRFLP